MRVERDDRLAGEIILVEEAVHHHRQVIPPRRIADEDRVILVKILDVIDQLRARALLLLVGGVVDEGIDGVFDGCVDGIQVAAHMVVDHIRQHADGADSVAVPLGHARGGGYVPLTVFRGENVVSGFFRQHADAEQSQHQRDDDRNICLFHDGCCPFYGLSVSPVSIAGCFASCSETAFLTQGDDGAAPA